jgi:hypothetical protein
VTDQELDLLETDVLVDALKRRSTALVLAMLLHQDADRAAETTWWHGSPHSALGLLEVSRFRLVRIAARARAVDPEGE